MIHYTGSPYVDAGVAALELRLHKPCDEFTLGDLDAQAGEIRREYTKKIWKSYLMVHLPNCAWTQKDLSSEKNQAYLKKVLESYKPEFPDLERKCAFCSRPAKILADRRYIPLLTGETVMTSGVGGLPGLPVCGWCVFAVHFYPFATLKVEGRPLFWWAPNPAWTRRLSRTFVEKLESVLAIMTEELPKIRWPKTQLLHAARQTMAKLQDERLSSPLPLSDIIGIHATNYGTDPNFEELRIPCGLLDFWSEAGSFPVYREIEQRAWEAQEFKSNPKKKSKQGKKNGETSQPEAKEQTDVPPEISELTRRNYLYEALGEAFRSDDYRERAKQVAVRFFLQKHGKQIVPGTMQITELFLEKVAGMERERLEAIREIADHIADDLILGAGERGAVSPLLKRKLRFGEFLQLLSRVQAKLSKAGKPLSWKKVLKALNLENEDDRTTTDHSLVQELLLIRLYERLASSPVLAELPEPEAPEMPSPEGHSEQIN